MKVIDPVKYRRIYEDVMKKLDKLENEFLPQVTVNPLCLTKIVIDSLNRDTFKGSILITLESKLYFLGGMFN